MEDDADLLAAFDADTGEFVDLVMSDSSGLNFRTDAEDWQPYQPGDLSLDGKEIIDVDESFVRVADKAFAARKRPTRDDALRHAADDGEAGGQ